MKLRTVVVVVFLRVEQDETIDGAFVEHGDGGIGIT